MRILLITLLFVSCSTVKNRVIDIPDGQEAAFLTNELKNVCFTSAGRGRIELGSEKYLVSYDALLEAEKNKWSLALDIPIHGEELISIEWKDKPAVQADFLKNLKKPTNEQESIEAFVEGLGNILRLASDVKAYSCKKNSAKSGLCELKDTSAIRWEVSNDEFILQTTTNSKKEIEFKAHSLNKKYERISVFMKNTANLELFISSCE